MAKKPGPKTDLTDELAKGIRQCILDGMNLKETAKSTFENIDKLKDLEGKEREDELANFTQKLYNWKCDNYLKISDKIEGWKRDRKIALAEGNIEDDLQIKSKIPEVKRIRQKASIFVLETLAKDRYSKRRELTGGDGEPLGVVVLPQRNVNTLDSDKKTSGSTSKD